MNDNICEFKDILNKYREIIPEYAADVLENEPMSLHTTFKIGGNASVFLKPYNASSLTRILEAAEQSGVRFTIIGNGSNLLFDDQGFNGAVISTEKMNSVRFEGDVLIADAGAMLSVCAIQSRDKALSGMERLYGIPGTVGGAIYMNAGAYGTEMKDIVVCTEYYDAAEKRIKTASNAEHKFGYRDSVFKNKNAVILSSKLSLTHDSADDINSRMQNFKSCRINKQPLEYPSAGSAFKRYPGKYTAKMIDEAGLKGYSVGGAQISEKHAGFVINRGGATASDVLALIETVKDKIRILYGIEIECEIIYVK